MAESSTINLTCANPSMAARKRRNWIISLLIYILIGILEIMFSSFKER